MKWGRELRMEHEKATDMEFMLKANLKVGEGIKNGT
jgi:hypothetical protein